MVAKDNIISLLETWGQWQRSAKNPHLSYVVSQYDSPLQKIRNVKPIYQNTHAEYLDKIILHYLPPDYRIVLELAYVERKVNSLAANLLHCSQSTYAMKRNEAICILQGIYSVLQEYEKGALYG